MNHAVDIFFTKALPRTVRSAKANHYARFLDRLGVFGHRVRPVIHRAFVHLKRHAIQSRAGPSAAKVSVATRILTKI